MKDLNKAAQLLSVLLGFFSTVTILAIQTSAPGAELGRIGLTLAVAAACAVRYWWVVLLLPWPFRVVRTALLLLAWSALVFTAAMVPDARRWAYALTALVTIGCATEVYNGLTQQWRVASERLSASLKRDHIEGAVTDALSAGVLVLAGATLSATGIGVLVFCMTAGTWLQLALMVRRHRAIMSSETGSTLI